MTTERTDTETNESKTEVRSEEKVVSSEVRPQAEMPLVDGAGMTESFLIAETQRNFDMAKKTWRYGFVAVGILSVYFIVLLSSIRSTIFDTDGIAAIIANEVDERVPLQIKNFETTMIAQAPDSANEVVELIMEYIPRVREEGQNAIEEVYSSIPFLSEEISSTIRVYMSENRTELKEFAETHSEQEFAMFLMNDIFSHVVADLDAKLKKNGEAHGWDAVKSVALHRIVALNNYLEKLANTGRYELNDNEQLQRRTIATWVKMLEMEE